MVLERSKGCYPLLSVSRVFGYHLGHALIWKERNKRFFEDSREVGVDQSLRCGLLFQLLVGVGLSSSYELLCRVHFCCTFISFGVDS